MISGEESALLTKAEVGLMPGCLRLLRYQVDGLRHFFVNIYLSYTQKSTKLLTPETHSTSISTWQISRFYEIGSEVTISWKTFSVASSGIS
jgi:hypothetical protein